MPRFYDLYRFKGKFGFVLFENSFLQRVAFPVFSKIQVKDIIFKIDPSAKSVHSSLSGKITEFLGGIPVDFSQFEVDLSGYSRFERSILKETQKIPYGRISTYGKISAKAGNPGSARATGQALKKNLTPIVVPCHRVVSVTGLGGFSRGINWKKFLLELEKE